MCVWSLCGLPHAGVLNSNLVSTAAHVSRAPGSPPGSFQIVLGLATAGLQIALGYQEKPLPRGDFLKLAPYGYAVSLTFDWCCGHGGGQWKVCGWEGGGGGGGGGCSPLKPTYADPRHIHPRANHP